MGFVDIGPPRQPVQKPANRRRTGQNIPRHHDETHLHGKRQESPEPLSPGDSGSFKVCFAPNQGKDEGDYGQNEDDDQRIWNPTLRPAGEPITPVFEKLHGRFVVRLTHFLHLLCDTKLPPPPLIDAIDGEVEEGESKTLSHLPSFDDG